MHSDDSSVTIGLIGLGVMGRGVARNLIKAGFGLQVYDLSQAARDAFADETCTVATTAAEAATGAHILITLLPDWSHVEAALLGDGDAAGALRKGALVIDMSTIAAAQSDRIGDRLTEMGLRFIDAPLGRTPTDAQNGTLLVIAGGTQEDIDEASGVFDAIGDLVIHAGARGKAIRLKLINNYMSTVGTMLVAEVLSLANKVGLDRSKTVEVLSNTTAGRGQLIVNYPKKVLAGDVTADFPLRMAQKDVSHALTLASENGVPMYLGAIARETFSLAKPWQREHEDWTAMLLLMEDIARIQHLPAETDQQDD